MRPFLSSNAGKGTLAVCLTALMIIQPLVATWTVAALTLAFGVFHFRQAFRLAEAEGAAAPRRIHRPEPAAGTALAVKTGGECRSCDVNAVMASLAEAETR